MSYADGFVHFVICPECDGEGGHRRVDRPERYKYVSCIACDGNGQIGITPGADEGEQ